MNTLPAQAASSSLLQQPKHAVLLWSLLALAVMMLSVPRFHTYNLLVVLGLYAYARLPAGHRTLSRPALVAGVLCGLLVLLALLAQLLAEVPQRAALVGLRDSLRGAFCFLLPFALRRAGAEIPYRTLIAVVLAQLLSLLAVHGYYVVQAGLDRGKLSDLMGLYVNRNFWAITISATMLLGLSLTLSLPRRSALLLASLLVPAGLALHVMNPSRGAVVSTLLVATLLLLVRFCRWRRIVVAIFFAGIGFVQLLYFVWLYQAPVGSYGSLDKWSSWRLSIHADTLQEILANPWTGHGLRAFSELIGARWSTLVGQHIDSPHNFLLDAAYTFGVPGALLLLVIAIMVLAPRLRATLSTVPSFTTLWSLALLGQLAVHGMQEGSLIRPYTLSALAVALALLTSARSAPDDAMAIAPR